mmetsp:Transcript_25622/g.62286  ORF Transcript_25622/g.62286 Transcript_25622/m.62286 type:complete len:180 (-) Transcript_25622:24-563(-)
MENLAPMSVGKVMREVRKLIESPVEGVEVFPLETNATEIRAEVIGPDGTPFEAGCFKMRLLLGAEFPDSPPKGYFLTKIFHPNVGQGGEICVNTLKKDWNKELGLRHIFLVIRCLLIDPNPESALNEEAGRLLLEDYDEYAKIARMWTDVHAKRKDSSSRVPVAKAARDNARKKTLKRL